jgi:hypothetical protein
MSVDPEGVADSPRMSMAAIFSALLGCLGSVSAIEPTFGYVSAAAILLALVPLILARRIEFSKSALGLAVLGLCLGQFGVLASVALVWHRDTLINQKAISVASVYLKALANGDRNTAIQMTGLPPMVEEESKDPKAFSREQQAVRNFLDDPNIRFVIERGNNALWHAENVGTKYRDGSALDMNVRFVDTNMANAQPILVGLRLERPSSESPDKVRRWYVQHVIANPRQ